MDIDTEAYFTTATDTPIGINTESTGMWPAPTGLQVVCIAMFRMLDMASVTCQVSLLDSAVRTSQVDGHLVNLLLSRPSEPPRLGQ